jgi:hypothetical protein
VSELRGSKSSVFVYSSLLARSSGSMGMDSFTLKLPACSLHLPLFIARAPNTPDSLLMEHLRLCCTSLQCSEILWYNESVLKVMCESLSQSFLHVSPRFFVLLNAKACSSGISSWDVHHSLPPNKDETFQISACPSSNPQYLHHS